MEVQVLRLGGVCIVAMGGEVFVEIGLAIERALQESHRAQMALTLGYSNSEVGYVCTASSYPEGGSEPADFYPLVLVSGAVRAGDRAVCRKACLCSRRAGLLATTIETATSPILRNHET